MPLKIDMENVVHGRSDVDNFSAELLRLIMKADRRNLAKLGHEYPNAVHIVKVYRSTGEIVDLPYD